MLVNNNKKIIYLELKNYDWKKISKNLKNCFLDEKKY